MPSGYFGLSTWDGDYAFDADENCMSRFQCTITGNLSQLEVYCTNINAGCNLKMAVYDDVAGVPTNLLLDAGAMVGVTGWNVIAGLTLAVVTGTYYWLAYCIDNKTAYWAYQSGGPANSYAYALFAAYATYPPDPTWVDGYGTNQSTQRAWVDEAGGASAAALTGAAGVVTGAGCARLIL